MSARDQRHIQSVQRALQLLTLFTPHLTEHGSRRSVWTVSDLARASGLHKSVVARLMATMAAQGFVIQDPLTRAYCVGPQAFAVGASYAPHAVLNTVARPIMEDLTGQCGHASYLGVPAGRHYIIIVAVESRHSLRVTIDVGESRHMHTGAIGKVLLAGLTDDAIRALLGADPLPRLTPQTITSVATLLHEVHEARRVGVAFNRGEAVLGAGSVAVAITDRSARAVAGLGIVYPQQMVTEAEIHLLAGLVARAGAAISTQLGAIDA